MSDVRSDAAGAAQEHAYDPATMPQLFSGVLTRRLFAFFIDAFVIIVLTMIGFVVVALLGIITFGLTWLLFGLVFPVVALCYSAFSLGGQYSATIGMRIMGLQMRTWQGAPMYPVLAAIHALFFWASISVLTPFILLVALFDARRRLLHDMFLGTVVINSEARS